MELARGDERQRTTEAERERETQSRERWAQFRPLLQLYSSLLVVLLISGLISHVSDDPIIELIFGCVFGGVVLIAAASRWADVAPAFVPPRLSARTAAEIAAAVTGVALVAEGYFWILERLGTPFVRYTDSYLAAGWPYWSMFALVSAFPGIFEEIAFRGVIQKGLERILSVKEALGVQAALFSVIHLSPAMFPSHLLLGLLFGWVRNRTASLYPGMILHAGWNALVVWRELAQF